MSAFLTTIAAMSESPLVRFLALVAFGVAAVHVGARVMRRLLDAADAAVERDIEAVLGPVPLYDRIAYEMAAGFDPDAVDWTEVSGR